MNGCAESSADWDVGTAPQGLGPVGTAPQGLGPVGTAAAGFRTSWNCPRRVRTCRNCPAGFRTSWNCPRRVRTSWNWPRRVRKHVGIARMMVGHSVWNKCSRGNKYAKPFRPHARAELGRVAFPFMPYSRYNLSLILALIYVPPPVFVYI